MADLHKVCFLLYNTAMKMTDEDKKKTWVIGVSGGADSMALLDMCRQAGMRVIVAHMNYQKRKSAERDMLGVKAYCETHKIPFECKLQKKPCVGNFQAFAREERYAFYREVIQRYQAAGVLVAHQLDDHLETYLMQKKRGSIPAYYGIAPSITIYGCKVQRPLLSYTKQELEQYCSLHAVPNYLDESNLSNAYTRNQIRHTIIDKQSVEEKKQLAEEIKLANKFLHTQQIQVSQFLESWKKDGASLCMLNDEIALMVLEQWIFSITNLHISHKECDTIYTLVQKQANNWTRSIHLTYDMRMEYGILSIVKKEEVVYQYTYDAIPNETTPFFTCAKQGGSCEAVTLYKEDFPITIRSPKQGDAIVLRFGTKKLNRWFIDRKIPHEERKIWPVVENAQGKIILVPKIGCDISHFSNNPTVFVIK